MKRHHLVTLFPLGTLLTWLNEDYEEDGYGTHYARVIGYGVSVTRKPMLKLRCINAPCSFYIRPSDCYLKLEVVDLESFNYKEIRQLLERRERLVHLEEVTDKIRQTDGYIIIKSVIHSEVICYKDIPLSDREVVTVSTRVFLDAMFNQLHKERLEVEAQIKEVFNG